MTRAMSSTACAAARNASTSAASFTIRNGPVTSVARRNAAPGSASCRARTKRAHVWSPIAAVRAPPAYAATRAIGSSVSSQVSSRNTSGCSTTRGASSRGTRSTASASRATTSIVSRSRGIAS